MKLEYLWIKEYKNIINQEFNFGSEFTYSLKPNSEGEGFILTKAKQENYIEKLFQVKGKGFENITAIVGENASGKSNVLTFIRGVLNNNFTYYDQGKAIRGQEYIAVFNLINRGPNSNSHVLLHTSSDSEYYLLFEHSVIYEVGEGVDSIFYSPVYDFNSYLNRSSNYSGVDVSSNYLIYDDHERQEFGFINLNQADYHKYQNVSRQIDFITNHNLVPGVTDVINIPESINLVIYENTVERENTDSFGFHNTPYEFRPFFDIGLKKFRKEFNELSQEEHKARKEKSRSIDDIAFSKIYLSYLFSLWKNMIANIEQSNDFLERGEVHSSIDTFSELSFEQTIFKFLNNQSIYNKRSIIFLTRAFRSLKYSYNHIWDYGGNTKIINAPLAAVRHVRIAYMKYLNELYKPAGSNNPFEFLSFDWAGLSTGEKAYLDLFSRIFYGITVIGERIRDSWKIPTRNSKFPNYVYLLLDEAELGFHLQWQKEYVLKLIQVIPILFGKYSPKLQLIFTTHSPISLSDVPQSNVIFLKKEGKNCKVIDNKVKPKHSFGANIHEMLYDAFYLQDGFIGNFAQHKIQEAIDWCNNKEVSIEQKEVEQIISVIDDPIVKIKLTEMYASKVGLNIEVERLKAQQAFIQTRLNELENND